MFHKIVSFFDKLENHIRSSLSHYPIAYAIIGAIGVILIWKGVEDIAGSIGLTGFVAFTAGLVILLMTGLLVSFFIGDTILISGFKKEEKISEKTESEVKTEMDVMTSIEHKLEHIEQEVEKLREEEDKK